MSEMLFAVEPSAVDLPLFEELRLEPFYILETGRHEVGVVQFEDGSNVEIWVNVVTHERGVLIFWDFGVYCAEGDAHYRVTSGGGDLMDFWDVVYQLANGMLDVEKEGGT